MPSKAYQPFVQFPKLNNRADSTRRTQQQCNANPVTYPLYVIGIQRRTPHSAGCGILIFIHKKFTICLLKVRLGLSIVRVRNQFGFFSWLRNHKIVLIEVIVP